MEPTEEQAQVINYVGSIRVLAAAGSGKTTTMAQKVKVEIDSGRCKAEEICFITFTRFAADQIKKHVKKVFGHKVDILCGTFHSMVYKLRLRAGIGTTESKTLYDQRMDVWVQEFMMQLQTRHPILVKILQTFKLLIIDEFQDLDETQFAFAAEFKKIQPDLRLIAIGDLGQNIYRFRGTSNEFLRTRVETEICPGIQTFKLTTNFRSTASILRVVNTLFEEEIEAGHILPMVPKQGAAEGVKPAYFEFAINPGKGIGEYEELVANTLLPILLRAKAAAKSVALIFPMTKTSSFELIMALIRQQSKERNYVLDLHKICKEDETCTTVTFKYDMNAPTSPVQFSTIHSAKGLEWDIVALIDMSDYLYELRGAEDCEAFYAEKTNLTYVGITRAAQELYVFANANGGGRHRKLAALGDSIHKIFDVTIWGTTPETWETQAKKPIAVTELVRKFPQHTDLFARAQACSAHIQSAAMDGFPMQCLDFYQEMREKNRELSFGTFIDWKLKRMLCGKQTVQDTILELMSCYYDRKMIYRADAFESLSLRLAKLDVYFMNASKDPSYPLEDYVSASRYLGLHTARLYKLVPIFKTLFDQVEKAILKAARSTAPNIKEQYILSQLRAFYTRGSVTEIHAIDAPSDKYVGMPAGLDSFVIQTMEMAAETLRACLRDTGATGTFRGDVCLESASLIMGEADIVSENGVLLEIKCGTSTKATEMRDVGNCKHLLQVLSYVALARHGTIPMDLKRACIVNPLTGAWERYDLSTWTDEQSSEFMECLEELRARC